MLSQHAEGDYNTAFNPPLHTELAFRIRLLEISIHKFMDFPLMFRTALTYCNIVHMWSCIFKSIEILFEQNIWLHVLYLYVKNILVPLRKEMKLDEAFDPLCLLLLEPNLKI